MRCAAWIRILVIEQYIAIKVVAAMCLMPT